MFSMIFFNPVSGYLGRHISKKISLGQISLIFYLRKKLWSSDKDCFEKTKLGRVIPPS